MSANAPTLGISIVNFGSSEDVSRLIRSVVQVARAGTQIRIAIADNSDEMNDLLRIRQMCETNDISIAVIDMPFNTGYATANNRACSVLIEAGADILWILNPDVEIDGGSLMNLVNEIYGSQAIWGTQTLEHGRKLTGLARIGLLTAQSSQLEDSAQGKSRWSLKYPGGHSLLATRDSWIALGGFCEDYFLFMEEADLANRASRIGYVVRSTSAIAVRHGLGGTTGTSRLFQRRSTISLEHSTRSRLIFFRKFYPRRITLIVLTRLVYAASLVAIGRPDGGRAVLRGLAPNRIKVLS